jgi:hypothetical protein
MHSYNKKDRELMDEYRKKDQRDHWIQESGALLDSALRSYKENYSADAILLRNELSKRLPPQPNQKDGAILYQNPTNVLGLGLVADHLELIAKSLPDS